MNIPWELIAIAAALIVVLQEVRIIQKNSNIRTLEHYIDLYKNKLEKYSLEEEKDGKDSQK